MTGGPHLGLVCITQSEEVRYRTVTRKRLLTFDADEQRRVLSELYAANLERLNRAIDFCRANHLRLYRITSGLFPFADDPAGEDLLEEFRAEARQTGERATAQGLRLILHPDQFVVLSSDSPEVVANSIKILRTHARVLDLLAQPRSAWAAIEIHGGKSGRGGTSRLGHPRSARSDSRAARARRTTSTPTAPPRFSPSAARPACRWSSTRITTSAARSCLTYDDPSVAHFLDAARETWPDPAWQLTHISNGRTAFNDRHHSDLITEMPEAYRRAPWIEVEAKHKEFAIEKLRAEWLPRGSVEGVKRSQNAER